MSELWFKPHCNTLFISWNNSFVCKSELSLPLSIGACYVLHLSLPNVGDVVFKITNINFRSIFCHLIKLVKKHLYSLNMLVNYWVFRTTSLDRTDYIHPFFFWNIKELFC